MRRIHFTYLSSEFRLLNFLTNEKQVMKLLGKPDKHNVKVWLHHLETAGSMSHDWCIKKTERLYWMGPTGSKPAGSVLLYDFDFSTWTNESSLTFQTKVIKNFKLTQAAHLCHWYVQTGLPGQGGYQHSTGWTEVNMVGGGQELSWCW